MKKYLYIFFFFLYLHKNIHYGSSFEVPFIIGSNYDNFVIVGSNSFIFPVIIKSMEKYMDKNCIVT